VNRRQVWLNKGGKDCPEKKTGARKKNWRRDVLSVTRKGEKHLDPKESNRSDADKRGEGQKKRENKMPQIKKHLNREVPPGPRGGQRKVS